MKRKPNTNEFEAGRAIFLREEAALHAVGGPDRAIRDVVDKIVERLRGETLTVTRMRELDGWTAIIEATIGPQPEAQPNDLGFATNPSWYVWSWLRAQKQAIRIEAQLKLGRQS